MTRMLRQHTGRMRGFSLVTAIFLLVVLAALAAVMVNISTFQQTESAMDVQGVRAEQAARAGLEWGLQKQISAGLTTGAACIGGTTFSLPASTTLSAFSVTVQCSTATGPGTLTSWTITATACNQPASVEPRCPNAGNNADYFQRRLQAVLSQ
ncbi:agglutinin biogenesis protein MshP [Janthinobacterium sp. BJB426]|uniref:agglutinin biogenesis protein MshP n=1 Tax=Janthinobacterium sp. BJB426 TaxID=2048010 RepID=UPI000C0E453C|nr:agglutinin biogenesis protein MshP [Janthinobacterium sp. BJB426]PHV29026.1 agglutinin biogenesis protein MshP [Janthinobacterium sp. BJB426]